MDKIDNRGRADAQLLFDGNYNCTIAGNAGRGIAILNDGGVDASCVSQLPMYLDCTTACPPQNLVDGKCPFGHWQAC